MSFNPFSKHIARTSFVHPNAAYILLTEEGDPGNQSISGDFDSGAWRTRQLNRINYDQTGLVRLSGAQFTLPAGRYRVAASATAGQVGAHVIRLFSITDSAVLYEGTEARSADESGVYSKSYIIGDFSILQDTTFELQHQCELSTAQVGLGQANSIMDPDVLSMIEFFKTNF
jgi:hypothetical protein